MTARLDSQTYDVVVLGSGIAGSTTALALAGAGLSVGVVERGIHPRFAIGESMVPTTTLGFDHLARRYRIPELAQLFSYPELARLGCTGWPKQHFWFGHHRAGRTLQRPDQLVFESLPLPRGPDVHLLRADSDAYLVSLFEKYRVDYADRTTLQHFETLPDRVRLDLVGEELGTRRVEAKLVVDCTGHGSDLARRLGLRDEVPNLKTDTRSIFGHFRNARKLEEVLQGPDPAFRYSRDGGTQHHTFDGGWIWVIRFDDDVSSVGVVFDRTVHPLDPKLSAEQEFAAIVQRFPTVAAQLGELQAIRPLVRTDRIQFSSRSILGRGFVLSPHAAAFVDALFSSGVLLSVAFSIRLAALAPALLRRPDYTLELAQHELRTIETAFLQELRQVDLVVAGMTKSLRSYDVMKQFFRVWLVSSYLQYTSWAGGRIENAGGCCGVYGAGIPAWRDSVEKMYAAVARSPVGAGTRSEAADARMAAELKGIMDGLPPEDPAGFPITNDAPVVLRANNRAYVGRWVRYLRSVSRDFDREIRPWRLWLYGLATLRRTCTLAVRAQWSRIVGGDLHAGIDFVRALRERPRPRSTG